MRDAIQQQGLRGQAFRQMIDPLQIWRPMALEFMARENSSKYRALSVLMLVWIIIDKAS